ncbi:hypothetical protein CEXT_179811 [Caerostris extrusa]|uniref:Uncharacterized protein n=1 Tax=Caerostris extrusa TaxID=172846 RepID=A0AAV4YBZ6_CAEEX|nr:hypothetical protein CEXT_179811 [Caerostris extrusa]
MGAIDEKTTRLRPHPTPPPRVSLPSYLDQRWYNSLIINSNIRRRNSNIRKTVQTREYPWNSIPSKCFMKKWRTKFSQAGAAKNNVC